MESFEVNLHKAMRKCEGYVDKNCHSFFEIYTFTTENVSDSIKYFDLKDKSLFTVGSSFDQVLNGYYYGARDITLFDINANAKYYAYLKIAAILCLSYTEFIEFFFLHGIKDYYNKNRFSKELFYKIKDTLRLLDYESFLFFDELFCLYDTKTIIDYLFDDDEHRPDVIKGFNIYLSTEENYNYLKSILKKISFKFVCGDIFKDNIDGKFDNMILSNLCTTTNIEELKKLLEKLDKNNLNDNGSILFAYLWGIDFMSNEYKDDWHDIYKMPITRQKLKKYITETHKIKSGRDILWDINENGDLILVYRKK